MPHLSTCRTLWGAMFFWGDGATKNEDPRLKVQGPRSVASTASMDDHGRQDHDMTCFAFAQQLSSGPGTLSPGLKAALVTGEDTCATGLGWHEATWRLYWRLYGWVKVVANSMINKPPDEFIEWPGSGCWKTADCFVSLIPWWSKKNSWINDQVIQSNGIDDHPPC